MGTTHLQNMCFLFISACFLADGVVCYQTLDAVTYQTSFPGYLFPSLQQPDQTLRIEPSSLALWQKVIL
jgi:hypothetical protein